MYSYSIRYGYTVAPSRVRGLKLLYARRYNFHGCRTFTGAWIETKKKELEKIEEQVAPSRVRGLKPYQMEGIKKGLEVAPSRVRGLKRGYAQIDAYHYQVAPSRVRGLKHGKKPSM